MGEATTEPMLTTALNFVTAHPQCSVIDLEPVLGVVPGEAWRIIHELENRRQVTVEQTPRGFRFVASSGA